MTIDMRALATAVLDAIQQLLCLSQKKHLIVLNEHELPRTNAVVVLKDCLDTDWMGIDCGWLNRFEQQLCSICVAAHEVELPLFLNMEQNSLGLYRNDLDTCLGLVAERHKAKMLRRDTASYGNISMGEPVNRRVRITPFILTGFGPLPCGGFKAPPFILISVGKLVNRFLQGINE